MTTTTSPTFNTSDRLLIGGALAATATAGAMHYATASAVLGFATAAVAMAVLASVVGHAVEQLGDRFGPGATGVLQSALGNLPELFISLFALKAGLVGVVKAALIGSILANLLLVMGLAFVVGGLRHGTQPLDSERARAITMMMILSLVALVMPSLATYVHTPAEQHEGALSVIVSLILLAIFAMSLPASLKRGATDLSTETGDHAHLPRWPVAIAVGVLAAAAVGAAFVSDWFVQALEPSMKKLGISEAFAGLVIVAIAGNAIENVVGIQLAAKNQSRYAFSVIINSPLQIALVLAPALVLLSHVMGFTAPLDLVFPPMLVMSVALAVIVAAFVTFDGESNWLEGAGLVAVYAIIAACFWWG